jgi:HEAT repeat protein
VKKVRKLAPNNGQLEQLVQLTLHDKDSGTRVQSAHALRNLKDSRTTDRLVDSLTHSSRWVRAYALEGLAILGDVRAVGPVVQALKDRSKVVRVSAAQTLGKLGSAVAIEPLIAALQDKEPFVSVRAAQALGQLKATRAIEPLLNLVENGSETLISVAAIELVHLGAEGTARRFISLLNSPNHTTRVYSAYALGQMHCREAVPALIGMLQGQDGEVQSAAMQALGDIGDARAFEALVDFLYHPSIHWVAERALGQLKDPRAIPILIQTLKVHKRRSSFAEAVAEIGEPAFQPVLDLLTSQQSTLRWNAVNALIQLWLRQPELHSIIQTGTVVPLIGALHDNDRDIRRLVARLLGYIADRRAIDPLVELVRTERHAKVRLEMVTALGAFSDPRVIEILSWVCTYDRGRTKSDSGWEIGDWVKISDQATRVLEHIRNQPSRESG